MFLSHIFDNGITHRKITTKYLWKFVHDSFIYLFIFNIFIKIYFKK